MSQPDHFISLLRRLWPHILPRRRLQLACLLALMLLGGAADMVSLGAVLPFLGALVTPEKVFAHPWTQPLIAALGLTRPGQLLLPMTALFSAAVALSAVIRLVLLWVQVRLGHAVSVDLGLSAWRRTLYQPYLVHVKQNSARIIATVVGKLDAASMQVILPLLMMASTMFSVATIVLFMMLINWAIAVVVLLGFGLAYGLTGYTARPRLSRDGRRMAGGHNRLTWLVQEGLGGFRDILINGLQEVYAGAYHRQAVRMRRASGNNRIVANAPKLFIEAFALLLIAWLTYIVVAGTSGLMAAIPTLGAFVLAAQRLLPELQRIYNHWVTIQGGKAALVHVLTLLEQPLPADHGAGPPSPLPFKRQIAVRRVRFRYGPAAPWVLRGLDLQIPRGSRMGFLGATGSGKTTLLDVIMGLLAPEAGALRVDDTPITAANYRAWQANIAHIPQVIFLADDTVKQNIAFGVPPAAIDEQRLRQAAQRAQIAAVVESWRDGYDTLVGERGIRLSGGQRQRIGIARALYKQASVLVFDEATSALDGETERAVMAAIDSLEDELTILLVAHRLTTLKNCDTIVELAAGAVRRIGTYQEIVQADNGEDSGQDNGRPAPAALAVSGRVRT